MKVRKLHKGAGMRHRANDSQVRAEVRYVTEWIERELNALIRRRSAELRQQHATESGS